MSSRSENASNPPASLTGLARRRWLRNARKASENRHHRDHVSPFVIPPSFYKIIHVHRFTSSSTMQTLINHFDSCYKYSINTESDRETNELSLIQIQTIPCSLPSFVVLLEVNHLPPVHSSLHDRLKALLLLLFRLGNSIFGWGPLSTELDPLLTMNLIPKLGPALLFNLQDEFFECY
jgi:hypothetical protein